MDKSIIVLLTLTMSLVSISCEDESEGEAPIYGLEAPIYGLWEWRYYYNDNSNSWDTTETDTAWSLLSEENYTERYLRHPDTDSSCYTDWGINNSIINSWEISAEDSATLTLHLTDLEIVISMKAVEDRLYWYYHYDDGPYLLFIAVRIDSYDFTPLCQ